MRAEAMIAAARAIGADLHAVEVKAAAGGLSSSIVATLSAFGNGDGGTLLLG